MFVLVAIERTATRAERPWIASVAVDFRGILSSYVGGAPRTNEE